MEAAVAGVGCRRCRTDLDRAMGECGCRRARQRAPCGPASSPRRLAEGAWEVESGRRDGGPRVVVARGAPDARSRVGSGRGVRRGPRGGGGRRARAVRSGGVAPRRAGARRRDLGFRSIASPPPRGSPSSQRRLLRGHRLSRRRLLRGHRSSRRRPRPTSGDRRSPRRPRGALGVGGPVWAGPPEPRVDGVPTPCRDPGATAVRGAAPAAGRAAALDGAAVRLDGDLVLGRNPRVPEGHVGPSRRWSSWRTPTGTSLCTCR